MGQFFMTQRGQFRMSLDTNLVYNITRLVRLTRTAAVWRALSGWRCGL